jgi:hypothetical protein
VLNSFLVVAVDALVSASPVVRLASLHLSARVVVGRESGPGDALAAANVGAV